MALSVKEIDKYLVIEDLGSGFFGQVFLVLDRALNVEKAIKVLNVKDPTEILPKLKEAEILYKCKHKNIVNVNEANTFSVSGVPKVVIDMEYITGGSLESYMKKNFVSTIEAMKQISGILYGLEFAHNQGILHRDIKPANILLDGNYSKLSDFGLATELGTKFFASPQGYTTHLAPEVFTTHTTTVLTDIYAVGVTFFRILNNITNWDILIRSLKDYERKIKSGLLIKELGFMKHIPNEIIRIVNKSCNPNPAKRYQSALEMRQAIERLKPKISWEKINDHEWDGICCENKDTYEVFLQTKKNLFIVRKNKRCIRSKCKNFNSISDGLNMMFNYVSQNTLG